MQSDRSIKTEYFAKKKHYGADAINAEGIVKYLMEYHDGVVNKENIFSAIGLMELEEQYKRDEARTQFQNRMLQLDDIQLQDAPSQVTHQETTINNITNSGSVNINKNANYCNCLIF